MNLKALVLIPSRFASTRFPGKPLAQINGKAMVSHVYDGCAPIADVFPGSKVCVVTDNDDIEKMLKESGRNVVRVDDDVPSGSERIYLAYERFFKDEKFDFVINVQGDEPLIKADLLKNLIEIHHGQNFDVATVIKEMSIDNDHEDYLNPNKVKAVFSKEKNICHYFTRSPHPYNRQKQAGLNWYLHIGIYSFRPEVLKSFCSLSESTNERIECLEQLRLLDNGHTIGAAITDMTLCGVDTPEDIPFVEGVINGQ